MAAAASRARGDLKLRLHAPAKLNLSLEVLRRREDGFHEIRSVVQAIALFDTLQGEPAARLELIAPNTPNHSEQNLVLRAAIRLRQAVGLDAGARLELQKGVPLSAGLGGGSSDAAATLRLLRRLWGISDGATSWLAIAAELGSDVPFFLSGGAALVSGRGEYVERLPPLRSGCFLLVVPGWNESRKTARVFAAVREAEYRDGKAARALANRLRARLPTQQAHFVNGLTKAAGRVFPDLHDFHRRLEVETEASFQLAGAGPSLFHLARSRAEAKTVAEKARLLGAALYMAEPLRRPTRIVTLDDSQCG